eukprot:6375233-Prymnesium_polylepis.1
MRPILQRGVQRQLLVPLDIQAEEVDPRKAGVRHDGGQRPARHLGEAVAPTPPQHTGDGDVANAWLAHCVLHFARAQAW